MTEEEAKKFENELLDKINKMTGHLTDKPRFQLSGETIPDSLLKENPDTPYSKEN